MSTTGTPQQATNEEVILELPYEEVGGKFEHVDEITVTTKRVTTDGNTFSLDGVTGVRYERIHLLKDAREYWIGWGLIAIGIPLLLTGIFGFLALAAGIMFVRENGRSKMQTGRIYLDYADGRKIVCYQFDLGSQRPEVWAPPAQQEAPFVKEKIQRYYDRARRMQLVAEKIGEAIGRK